jgi:hypothetical protein
MVTLAYLFSCSSQENLCSWVIDFKLKGAHLKHFDSQSNVLSSLIEMRERGLVCGSSGRVLAHHDQSPGFNLQ